MKGTLPGTPLVIPFEKYITICLRHQERKNALDKIPILFTREENRNILITIPVWLHDGHTDTGALLQADPGAYGARLFITASESMKRAVEMEE